jgi:hypothetical protein
MVKLTGHCPFGSLQSKQPHDGPQLLQYPGMHGTGFAGGQNAEVQPVPEQGQSGTS